MATPTIPGADFVSALFLGCVFGHLDVDQAQPFFCLCRIVFLAVLIAFSRSSCFFPRLFLLLTSGAVVGLWFSNSVLGGIWLLPLFLLALKDELRSLFVFHSSVGSSLETVFRR